MSTDNVISEIRNQIVMAVIEANKAGAKCGIPDHFKITRETLIGIVEYSVPIVLTKDEMDTLRNIQ